MPNEFDPFEGAVTAVLLALLAPLDDNAISRILYHAGEWNEDREYRREAERRAAA